jgi:hypothetical protein
MKASSRYSFSIFSSALYVAYVQKKKTKQGGYAALRVSISSRTTVSPKVTDEAIGTLLTYEC